MSGWGSCRGGGRASRTGLGGRGGGRGAFGLLLAVGLALPGTILLEQAGSAQTKDPELTHQLALEPAAVRPGEWLRLELTTTIPPGFKLYGLASLGRGPLPTRLRLQVPPDVTPAPGWSAPPPTPAYDPNFRQEVLAWSGTVRFQRALQVLPGAAPGPRPLTLTVQGQICDAHRCLLQRQELTTTLAVEAGPVRPAAHAPPALAGAPQPEEAATAPPAAAAELLGAGVWRFLLLAFLAGLLSLLTPCVFPMIPLTVSFFSKAADERSSRVLRLAATFALSIVVTFTGLGMLISVLFGAAGLQRFAAHPVFNLFVAGVLVAFGLSLLGLFELRLPSGLIERSEGLKQRFASRPGGPGTLSVFFMALTFTLVSFSCTVAFLGPVLVLAAQGQWFWPAMGMLAFSGAFALPFFLLALFPRAATRLQGGSGHWLPVVKLLLGLLELAAALKFLSNVDLVWGLGLLSRTLALALWIGLALAAALLLLRLVRLAEDVELEPGVVGVGVGRLLLGVGALAVAIYLSVGLVRDRPFGNWVDGWLPPLVLPGEARPGLGDLAATGGPGRGPAIPWRHSLPEAREEARQTGRPLFLNFTGVTCTNCRYMEEAVLPRPEIAARIARFVPVELYTDRPTAEDEAHRSLQIETFATAALPLYAVVTPDWRVLASFPGSTNDPAEFLRFLEGIPELAPAAAAPVPGPPPPVADAGLDFSLPRLLPGPAFRLAELRGKFVLVHHWASWCGPCRQELQGFFLRVTEELALRGLTLVTIAFDGGDPDGEAAARQFAREVGLDRWPALLAPAMPDEAGLPPALRPSTFPTTQLLGPAGELRWSKSGELSEAELRQILEQQLLPAPGPPPVP